VSHADDDRVSLDVTAHHSQSQFVFLGSPLLRVLLRMPLEGTSKVELSLPLPFLPSNMSCHLSFRPAWLVWKIKVSLVHTVYRAYMFVDDGDDEQATTLYKSVLQNIVCSASQCVIWVTNR